MGPGIASTPNVQVLEFASIFVTILSLGVGSVYDLKTREVSDKVWMIYGLIGIALTIDRLFVNRTNLILTFLSVALAISISLVMSHFGLFAGADAKSIICLSLAIPVFPQSLQPLFGRVLPFFPLDVIVTGYVIALSVPLWIGARNLITFLFKGGRMFQGLKAEPAWKKLLAALTGYQTSLRKLQSTFYLYPLEKAVSDSKGARRVFQLYESAEADRDTLVSNFMKSHSKLGPSKKVWVTPGLPMVLFFLIGVIVVLVVGDPIFALLNAR